MRRPLATKSESGMLRRMSKRRYVYQRISGAELSKELDRLGLTKRRFAKIYGVPDDRVQQWMDDDEDIPHSVAVMLKLLALPGGLAAASTYTDTAASDLRNVGDG